MKRDSIPSYTELIQPTLTALHDLGGIAGTFMVDEAVIERLQLPEEALERTRPAPQTSRSEIGYRLAWARTYLKSYGLLENPQRGLWQLTPLGRSVRTVDAEELVRSARRARTK
ncbi:MAG: winged helix-turn-helix domain-containing protein [Actinomycetota bacterium]|nr:winged helix-turn-helix domain-containing protein [Actinomycetota bacterium]